MARCNRCDGSGQGSGGYNGECGYCEGTGQGACDACGCSRARKPTDCSSHHSRSGSPRKEEFMTTAFVPKHATHPARQRARAFGFAAVPVRRPALVGGKLVNNRQGLVARVSCAHTPRACLRLERDRDVGARWVRARKSSGANIGETVFAVPEVAKAIAGPRYERVGHVVKEKAL